MRLVRGWATYYFRRLLCRFSATYRLHVLTQKGSFIAAMIEAYRQTRDAESPSDA